ncbi:hypothetical protein [Fulvimonas yonginensis]|uniref:Uncharacterized protein n=1 Tax=Fulvimonas yonginensis TaxID=1495200 RepID=A0ABU8JER0_9GAMM
MSAAFEAAMRSAREAIIAPRLQAQGLGWVVLSHDLGAFPWSPSEAFQRAKAAGLIDEEALTVMRALSARLEATRPAFRYLEAHACSVS